GKLGGRQYGSRGADGCQVLLVGTRGLNGEAREGSWKWCAHGACCYIAGSTAPRILIKRGGCPTRNAEFRCHIEVVNPPFVHSIKPLDTPSRNQKSASVDLSARAPS